MQRISMAEDLKPCPFCGGRVYPVYWSRTEKYYIQHYRDGRKTCAIDRFELTDGAKCLKDVYEMWNRRTENV